MLDTDDILRQAKAQGVPIPSWKWPPLKTYNGFTHKQRVKVWQAVKVAIAMGLMPHPSTRSCEICRSTQNLCYHSEDYSVVEPHVVCHRLIHQRFKLPEAWRSHITRYHVAGAWFTSLKAG